ncbi:MAG: endonuclease/exonuclease/phosphatase family protein [Nocardioides sp.]|uniref:endonuclease/exonuclease/phosphatase family protein n=1 Tax=Nocardioides sp. TaxID=35761 RepID=UPI003F124436
MVLWVVALASLGVAMTLYGLRASGTMNPRLAQVVAFAPFGLPAALLGLVCALALRRRARVAPLLLGGLCAVLAVGHAWWQAPLYVGSTPRAGTPTVVVAAQNFEFGDADALVSLVARHDVGVLVVTDVGPARIEELRGAGIEALLPYEVGADRGTSVLSRFPVQEKGLLSPGGDSQFVSVTVPGVGPVDVAAVHPTPPYQGEKWATDWERVLSELHRAHDPVVDTPTVVAGDLNATLDHAPLHDLEALGLVDAAEATNSGWAPTWPADGSRRILGVRVPSMLALDHVLSGGGLVPVGFAVDGAVGSDHAAVVATLGPAS